MGILRDGGATRVAMVDGLTMSATWATTGTGDVVASAPFTGSKIWLRASADIRPGASRKGRFAYSTDGVTFLPIGTGFTLNNAWQFFMGYRFAVFNYATTALGGAVVTTLVSNLPFVGFINCLLFAGFWGSAIFAVWLYRRLNGSVTLSEAVRLGALTGLCAGALGFALSFLGLAGFQGTANELSQILPALRGYNLQPQFQVAATGPADKLAVKLNARPRTSGLTESAISASRGEFRMPLPTRSLTRITSTCVADCAMAISGRIAEASA